MKLPVVLNQPPNVFDKKKVHDDLEANQNLWQHVAYFNHMMGVYGLESCDVQGINYYIVAVPDMEHSLIDLAAGWNPGRLEWSKVESCPPFSIHVQGRHLGRRAKVLRVAWVV